MNPRSSDRKACFSMFCVDSVSYAPKCMTTRLARKLSTVSSAFSTFAHGVCDSFKERRHGDRPVSGSLQQKQISYVICSLNSGLVSGTMITTQPPHTPRLHRAVREPLICDLWLWPEPQEKGKTAEGSGAIAEPSANRTFSFWERRARNAHEESILPREKMHLIVEQSCSPQKSEDLIPAY